MAFDIRFEDGIEPAFNLAGDEWDENVLRVIVNEEELLNVPRDRDYIAVEIERMLMQVVRMRSGGHRLVLETHVYPSDPEESLFEKSLKSDMSMLFLNDVNISDKWQEFYIFPKVLRALGIEFDEVTINRYVEQD